MATEEVRSVKEHEEKILNLVLLALYRASWAFNSVATGDKDGEAYEEILEVQECLLKVVRMYYDGPPVELKKSE